MSKLLSLSLIFALFAAGCSSDKPADPNDNQNSGAAQSGEGQQNGDGSAKQADPVKKVVGPTTKEVAVRQAKCGCSIEGIGKCGNYIMVEGQYVPLIHKSLGKMEFCQHKDAGCKIKVAGLMKDGKYVAEQWKLSK